MASLKFTETWLVAVRSLLIFRGGGGYICIKASAIDVFARIVLTFGFCY